MTDRRREIDARLWNPAAGTRPERITFGAYAAGWLAHRQVAGRPIKARTRAHYQAIQNAAPAAGVRGTCNIGAITPEVGARLV